MNDQTRFDKVVQLLDEQKPALALESLEKLNLNARKVAEFYIYRSSAFNKLGNISAAIKDAEEAVRIGGGKESSWFALGMLEKKQGNYQSAESSLISAARCNSLSPELREAVILELMDCQILLHKPEYKGSVELAVKHEWLLGPELFQFLSRLVSEGMVDDFSNYSEQFLHNRNLNSLSANQIVTLAQNLQNRSLDVQALQFLDDAVSYYKTSEYIIFLELGWQNYLSRRLSKSKDALLKAIELMPSNAHGYCSLAWVLSDKEMGKADWAESLAVAKEMLDKDGYPQFRKLKVLARCQLRNGLLKEAKQTILAGCKIAPVDEHDSLQDVLLDL